MRKWMALLLALVLLCACARAEITTVLLAGTDRSSTREISPLDHRSGGQADFLLLLALDSDAGTIAPLHIDRDAITEITTLSVLGRESGSRRAQICLAHSFGDGREKSAGLLCRAVEGLLGVPVDFYFTLCMDGIAAFNDALGGVEVTLDANFTHYDPAMTAGRRLILQGRQALYYLARRYHVGDETNAGREARQRSYIRAAAARLQEGLKDGPGVLLQLLDLMDGYVCTDMDVLTLAALGAAAGQYEILPIRTLPGEHRAGENGFIEFIPDEPALHALTAEIFGPNPERSDSP